MVTENGRLAEVTEAAERMGIIPPLLARRQNLQPHRDAGFHRGKARRRTGQHFLCGFSLCASVLAVVRILPLSTQSSFFVTSSFTS